MVDYMENTAEDTEEEPEEEALLALLTSPIARPYPPALPFPPIRLAPGGPGRFCAPGPPGPSGI